jgi:four helix bundle suffix protein
MMVGAGMSARDGNLEAQGESPRQCRGNGVLPPHGGYQNLLSYQRAEVVYDATVRFCQAVFSKYDRMVDQMVQAARSGKQNIVEGSMASGTSREMELKLTNVARASLEELLADYRDFLRQRGAEEWDKNSREALYVRRLAAGKIVPPKEKKAASGKKQSPLSPMSPMSSKSPRDRVVTYEDFRCFEDRTPEVRANIIISLIKQTNYLLDRQIRKLEEIFLKEGGLRERMTRSLGRLQLAPSLPLRVKLGATCFSAAYLPGADSGPRPAPSRPRGARRDWGRASRRSAVWSLNPRTFFLQPPE